MLARQLPKIQRFPLLLPRFPFLLQPFPFLLQQSPLVLQHSSRSSPISARSSTISTHPSTISTHSLTVSTPWTIPTRSSTISTRSSTISTRSSTISSRPLRDFQRTRFGRVITILQANRMLSGHNSKRESKTDHVKIRVLSSGSRKNFIISTFCQDRWKKPRIRGFDERRTSKSNFIENTRIGKHRWKRYKSWWRHLSTAVDRESIVDNRQPTEQSNQFSWLVTRLVFDPTSCLQRPLQRNGTAAELPSWVAALVSNKPFGMDEFIWRSSWPLIFEKQQTGL